MASRKSTETPLFSFFIETAAGAGIAGITPLPTCDVFDPSGDLAVNDGNVTEVGRGVYTYSVSGAGPFESGRWHAIANTAVAGRAKDDWPSFVDVGKGGVDYLTGDAYERLGAPVSTSISADIADLPTASQVAAAVDAPTTSEIAAAVVGPTTASTLGALSENWDTPGTIGAAIGDAGAGASTPTQIAAAVWAYAKGTPVAGSILEWLEAQLIRILASPFHWIFSSGPNEAGVLEIIPGDAYSTTHQNRKVIPIPSAPDLDADGGATLAFTVDGLDLGTVTPTWSGTGVDRQVDLALTAAQTTVLDALPSAIQKPEDRKYWRVVATWVADTPSQPVTIAQGEIRRPTWDRR